MASTSGEWHEDLGFDIGIGVLPFTAGIAEAPAEPAKAPAAAPAEMPPIIGFLPPRMKLMVLRNCHHDLETYCADVPFGEGRNLRCLFGHKAALTSDCQGVLARLTH